MEDMDVWVGERDWDKGSIMMLAYAILVPMYPLHRRCGTNMLAIVNQLE
jgi:hypothetical protein